MLRVGKWFGFYGFSDENINKIRGFEKTNFEIEILSLTDNKFIGNVQDDLTTGGTEGVGEIVGEQNGDSINFVKRMPVMTLLVNNKGERKTLKKKHRPIFYTGQFSSDGLTVSGTWCLKFGFFWIGIIPIPIRRSKGIWQMTIKNDLNQ